jgi:hypothetical protein
MAHQTVDPVYLIESTLDDPRQLVRVGTECGDRVGTAHRDTAAFVPDERALTIRDPRRHRRETRE